MDLSWLTLTLIGWSISPKSFKDKALYNAVMHSIQIIDGQDKAHTVDVLPHILSDALGGI